MSGDNLVERRSRQTDCRRTDFTKVKRVVITLGGESLPHLLFHHHLAWSGWAYGQVIHGGESFVALSEGLQNALAAFGGVTRELAPIDSRPPTATVTAATPSTSRPATRPSAPISGSPPAGTSWWLQTVNVLQTATGGGLDRSSQGLVVAVQLVEISCTTWDLGDRPVPDRGTQGCHVPLQEEVAERGIRWRSPQLKAQRFGLHAVVADGKTLQVSQAQAAAQDPPTPAPKADTEPVCVPHAASGRPGSP